MHHYLFSTFETDTSEISGPTVYDNLLDGDLSALDDLLVPTHVGFRIQGEVSLSIAGIGGWSPAASLGTNFVHNSHAGESDNNVDLTVEPWSGGILSGGSITGGILIGWGSSTVDDVTTGQSEIFGGTIAGGPALSITVVAPLNSDGSKLHVDSTYGIVPTTLYIGFGAGAGYAGAGAGRSTSIYP